MRSRIHPDAAPIRRIITPRTATRSRLRDVLRYRELLGNLIRKELKVKYKNSALGFLWSMLNPLLYLVIFWIVFTKFLGAGIPMFPIYLLAGLLAWHLFSGSLGGSVASMVGNAPLVTKVYFPRETLPLSSIGANLVHFALQLVVLLGALVLFRVWPTPESVFLIPTALLVLLVFLLGACMTVAVANVFFRDVAHLLELALLGWFWMTPIVYPIRFVQDNLPPLLWKIYMANPITPIVLAFQRSIYGRVDAGIYGRLNDPEAAQNVQAVLVDAPATWYLRNLLLVGLGSLVVLAGGWLLFNRFESRLAEEL